MEDSALIEQIKKGDILAFETLLERYERKLISFVNRIVFDTGASEEIVQDAFFNVYKSINRIDSTRKFSTYLFEIAKNGAFSYLRSHKKTEILDEDIQDRKDVFLDEYGLGENIDKLEKKYQDVIKMYYFEDLSYEEIAAKLNLPVNTVRTHLKRAKDKLKVLLSKNV